MKNFTMKSVRNLTLVIGVISFSTMAMADDVIGSGSLKLPEDIEARKAEAEANEQEFQIQESRIAGRLERVTVKRKNGLDEVYENKDVDSMWATEEKELGEIPNVRRWTIGSW